MLFPVELERSAGRQRPQDTPTSRLLFRRLPSHTFPSAVLVLRFALLAALRLSPISTRLVLAWLPLPTGSTGFERPTSAETWPRACDSNPEDEIARAAGTDRVPAANAGSALAAPVGRGAGAGAGGRPVRLLRLGGLLHFGAAPRRQAEGAARPSPLPPLHSCNRGINIDIGGRNR
jgi:hypothetical protein